MLKLNCGDHELNCGQKDLKMRSPENGFLVNSDSKRPSWPFTFDEFRIPCLMSTSFCAVLCVNHILLTISAFCKIGKITLFLKKEEHYMTA